MGKSPDVNFPDPIDPAPAIAQQQQGNVQAAIASTLLNQVNQFGPGGSSVFSPTGQSTQVGGFNIPQFQQQVTLSPAAQQQFEAQQRLGSQLGQLAEANVQRVADVQATPFTTQGLPEIAAGVSAGDVVGAPTGGFGQVQTGVAGGQAPFAFGAPIQQQISGFDPQAGLPQGTPFQFAPVPTGPGTGPQPVQGGVLPSIRGFPGSGNIPNLNIFNIPGISGGLGIGGETGGFIQPQQGPQLDFGGARDIRQDFAQQGSELERATFEQVRGLLEPEFQRQLGAANIAITERGLPVGSQAAQGLIDPIVRQQQQALSQAGFQAVGAGRQEQQRLAQLALQQRGQQVGEAVTQAQFGLQAGGQQFGQQLAGAEFGLGARGQQFGQQLAGAQFGLGAQGQQFGQQLAGVESQRAGAAQRFGQSLAGAEFGQSEAQRQFGQQLAGGQFANQAQQQQFAQALGLQGAQNVAQQQAFQQALTNAQLQTAARTQGFQERAAVRNIPINEIAALLGTAPGVQVPQFQQQPAFGINATDVIGATLGANQQNIQAAQASGNIAAQQNAALFGLAGDIGTAFLPSDRRIKRDIKELGVWNGLKTYSYRYLGGTARKVGVMAQEVKRINPAAVSEINGIMAVSYGAL